MPFAANTERAQRRGKFFYYSLYAASQVHLCVSSWKLCAFPSPKMVFGYIFISPSRQFIKWNSDVLCNACWSFPLKFTALHPHCCGVLWGNCFKIQQCRRNRSLASTARHKDTERIKKKKISARKLLGGIQLLFQSFYKSFRPSILINIYPTSLNAIICAMLKQQYSTIDAVNSTHHGISLFQMQSKAYSREQIYFATFHTCWKSNNSCNNTLKQINITTQESFSRTTTLL